MINNGPQSKDDQLSDKSELSEPPARIEDIFEWIEGIPLSKTTKNLARDFSDAVLMAEILKFYYPHIVSPHNYIPVNSIQNKKENWNTLNRKVLSKIDMKLSNDMIDQLAHSQPGVIDKLLNDFRDKQMSFKVKGEHLDEARLLQIEPSRPANRAVEEQQPPSGSIFGKIGCAIYNFFAGIFGLIVAILCFWRWFSRSSQVEGMTVEQTCYAESEEQHRNEEDEEEEEHQQQQQQQLRESYGQAIDELRVKADVIKTLCHKVAFLEGTMKLKDMKISTLTTQLEQQNAAVDAMGIGTSSTRPSTNSTVASSYHSNAAAAGAHNPIKMRKRPRTQI